MESYGISKSYEMCVLAYHNHFVSTAHIDADLAPTFERVGDAFAALGRNA